MIPGLSPETASSLALAPPRHVPRHRHLRGRRPGHDPPRREGRGSYQPRSDPLPLLARRFKRLSAVPWAPTWRPGPRHGVLERPRTARTARRLRAAQSLTGVVVSRGSAATFRLVGAGRDAPWLGGLGFTVLYVHRDLPSISLPSTASHTADLLPLQGHLQAAFCLRPRLWVCRGTRLPCGPRWPGA